MKNKLIIPKIIAKWLDVAYEDQSKNSRQYIDEIINDIKFSSDDDYIYFYKWIGESDKNYDLCLIYLLGKYFNTEFVEVVE